MKCNNCPLLTNISYINELKNLYSGSFRRAGKATYDCPLLRDIA